MRFLVTYYLLFQEAIDSVAECGCTDVQVLDVRPREKTPRPETAADLLTEFPDSEIAFVGVEKKYRKSCENDLPYCQEVRSLATIRGGTTELKKWLVPEPSA